MRDGEVEVEIIARDSLEVGDSVQGPAMIQDPDSTVLVEVGWDCVVSPARSLTLTRAT
jgi:N-methylhydantoinase A/oxoprolinase/acetone carboxylase beta subunit